MQVVLLVAAAFDADRFSAEAGYIKDVPTLTLLCDQSVYCVLSTISLSLLSVSSSRSTLVTVVRKSLAAV